MPQNCHANPLLLATDVVQTQALVHLHDSRLTMSVQNSVQYTQQVTFMGGSR